MMMRNKRRMCTMSPFVEHPSRALPDVSLPGHSVVEAVLDEASSMITVATGGTRRPISTPGQTIHILLNRTYRFALPVVTVRSRPYSSSLAVLTPVIANSLVAVGDEDGTIALLESAKDSNPTFDIAHVKIRPHSNAVMDLSFSSNDLLLATASGDQTGHVIDVCTQQSTYVMGGSAGHQSSVKQVRFQPGNDNVIATSSRDGTVRLWDLRCSGSEGAIRNLVGFDGQPTVHEHKCTYLQVYNTISGAHTERHGAGITSQTNASQRLEGSSSQRPFHHLTNMKIGTGLLKVKLQAVVAMFRSRRSHFCQCLVVSTSSSPRPKPQPPSSSGTSVLASIVAPFRSPPLVNPNRTANIANLASTRYL